jgi:hypothetical protein
MDTPKPFKITSFPGEKVDQHLKRYGHLPGDENLCCARETFDDTRQFFKDHFKRLLSEKTKEKQLILAGEGIVNMPILFEVEEIGSLIDKV